MREGFAVRSVRVQSIPLLLAGCATPGRPSTLSGPQFLHLMVTTAVLTLQG